MAQPVGTSTSRSRRALTSSGFFWPLPDQNLHGKRGIFGGNLMRRRRTTPHEKELYWVLATSQREDDRQYTVKQRVFETVLRCLDEPLPVAKPAKEACESTKKILKRNKHPRDGADERKDKEKGP